MTPPQANIAAPTSTSRLVLIAPLPIACIREWVLKSGTRMRTVIFADDGRSRRCRSGATAATQHVISLTPAPRPPPPPPLFAMIGNTTQTPYAAMHSASRLPPPLRARSVTAIHLISERHLLPLASLLSSSSSSKSHSLVRQWQPTVTPCVLNPKPRICCHIPHSFGLLRDILIKPAAAATTHACGGRLVSWRCLLRVESGENGVGGMFGNERRTPR